MAKLTWPLHYEMFTLIDKFIINFQHQKLNQPSFLNRFIAYCINKTQPLESWDHERMAHDLETWKELYLLLQCYRSWRIAWPMVMVPCWSWKTNKKGIEHIEDRAIKEMDLMTNGSICSNLFNRHILSYYQILKVSSSIYLCMM